MARRKKDKPAVEANVSEMQPNAAPVNSSSKNIFSLANRGMLLDVFVFFMNLFLMRWLTRLFWEIIQQASDGDSIAAYAIFLFFIAIFILPALGSILKRWHFHRRLQLKGKDSNLSDNMVIGCLCNPIFFFCLNVLIYIGIMILIEIKIYGDKPENNVVAGLFAVFGIVLVAIQTGIVFRYFSIPKNPPKSEFFRSPLSELLADVCIFLNMILFQVIWNVITTSSYSTTRVKDVEEFIGRIFMWSFIALLVYFPPRLFYLAEDITKRRVWLTMLLANLPVLFRVLIGTR
jgi:hypothetical protein